MSIQVGYVISVKGVRIIIEVYDESNRDVLFFDGIKYKGVSIREYLIIQRGFIDIVCFVEGEYLDEQHYIAEQDKRHYVRKIELKAIGYFHKDAFFEGVKYLPMIKDPAFLVSDKQISKIYQNGEDGNFFIGKLLKENIPIALPWSGLFNTHIGIFGNTGSGKSNTLTKIYTELFIKKLKLLKRTSKFVLLDFNGEYTGSQITNDKIVYHLNTHIHHASGPNVDKFPLSEDEFWNTETLGILFKATENTQKPFIKHIINGRNKYKGNENSLNNYFSSSFKKVFTTVAPKRETIDLLINILKVIDNESLIEQLQKISWYGKDQKFKTSDSGVYFNGGEEANLNTYFGDNFNHALPKEMDSFNELLVRMNLQLINDIISGFVQFEHIQPLLKRVESSLVDLRKIMLVENDESVDDNAFTVISLRNCKQEIKKIVPLLLAKHYYEKHKKQSESPPQKTIHLIIDEAHNILSEQSTREHEAWKDYRLELFEEIIKEGRKFGVFLTLASQRPADISPTIMSQIHNFFIHRLVNDRDLFLLDNTINTLDSLSREMIPNLARACCIVTGTSFDLPYVLQVDLLERKELRPDSGDVDLKHLWSEILVE